MLAFINKDSVVHLFKIYNMLTLRINQTMTRGKCEVTFVAMI